MKHQTMTTDFTQEYNEIIKLADSEVLSVQPNSYESGQIKKFTLFDSTPTPILTDHIQ
jgi:hypothetical protein